MLAQAANGVRVMATAEIDATDRKFDVIARGSAPGSADAVLFHGVSLSMATAQEGIP